MRNVGSMQSAHSFITVKEYLKVYHRKLTNHEWQFGRNWKCFFFTKLGAVLMQRPQRKRQRLISDEM